MPLANEFSLYDTTAKLPSIFKQRAKKELNEDAATNAAHLESFRRWIASMPHISCPIEDQFLLAFLRHAKFNHSKAQKRIDNFCTFRTSETVGYPAWFKPRPDREALWKNFLNLKHFIPLGFTSSGVFCSIVQFKNWSDSSISLKDLFYALNMLSDAVYQDERIQIGGIAYIMDFTGMGTRDIQQLSDPEMMKFSAKYFQEAQPFRIKKLIYYNVPRLMESVIKLITTWLNEKNKSKILIIKDSWEMAYEDVPGLSELIPSDYNGNGESSDSITEKTKTLLADLPTKMPMLPIAVDESKRPAASTKLMKDYKDLKIDLMGTSGTFVKLEDEL